MNDLLRKFITVEKAPWHGLSIVIGTFLYIFSAITSNASLLLRSNTLEIITASSHLTARSLTMVPLLKSVVRLGFRFADKFDHGPLSSVYPWLMLFGFLVYSPTTVWTLVSDPLRAQIILMRWRLAILEVWWVWLDVRLLMLQWNLPEGACSRRGVFRLGL